MTREEAISLLEKHIQADTLRKHCYATEAIMRALAHKFHQDDELWGQIGLLHDLDFEYTRNDPAGHGLKTVEILAPCGFPGEGCDAILRHNAEALKLQRETRLDFALTCAETITGLIVAAALVHPGKNLGSLTPQSVRKRMKSKDFARNVNREHLMLCERIDIPLMDFIELSIAAMTSISGRLGL
ncbi:MAG: HDIG domain-containing protein [Deltaproteobacteria bacterium]|jgi:putative nucleotidyltransferase with HDIG domain|nr:HDIG domain-containing protein [Deltaproteobacteria bacterium]